MPNWVKNVLQMKGVAKLPLYDKAGNFDFNKIVPMPPELEVESGSYVQDSIMYYLTDRLKVNVCELTGGKRKIVRDYITNMFNEKWPEELFGRLEKRVICTEETDLEKMYQSGKAYVDNIRKYGFPTWYEWSLVNWDTKWNAHRTEIVGDDMVIFETAWSEPAAVICKLHEMYPDIDFEHTWADEGVGSYSGSRWVIDGDMDAIRYEQDSPEALEAYVKCWGETDCIYIGDDGKPHRRNCNTCRLCD